MLNKLPSRNLVVPHRALPLGDSDLVTQIGKGLYVVNRGERFAIPVDRISEPKVYQSRDLWRQDRHGRVFRAGVRMRPRQSNFQRRALAWARDHVHKDIPYWYYLATLGHDLHASTYADLYGRHWHAGWANPFNPDRIELALDPTFETLFKTHFVEHDCRLGDRCPALLGVRLDQLQHIGGFVEDLGWLSGGKVTTAFVSEEIDELVSTTGTEYADFDFHEVGTGVTAEANTQTALITTTAIARATGTPTDADPIYRNVGTITADTTETWQEHGVFNNATGAAMMDRSLTGGQSVASPDQVQYTYELTKNAEA
jgi:hypothetical protein